MAKIGNLIKKQKDEAEKRQAALQANYSQPSRGDATSHQGASAPKLDLTPSATKPAFTAPSVSEPTFSAPTVTQPPTLDGLTARRDALRKERESVAKEYDWLYTQEQDPDSVVGAYSSRFKSASDAKSALAKIDAELNNIASQYYTTSTLQQKDALFKDKDAFASKQSADALTADIARLDSEIQKLEAMDKEGSFNTSKIRTELAAKYGLTGKNYTAYTFRAALQEKLDAAKKAVKDAGHDYDRIAEYEQTYRDKHAAERAEQATREYASQHPVAASIASVAASPIQGVDYLGAAIKGIGRSDTDKLDEYVPLNSYKMVATNFVSTVRDQVSKDIEEKTDWEIAGQNVASFLYNTGMSIADSTTQIATLGPASMVFMGASAASNQAKKIIDQGGTNSQALLSGLAAGAAEAVFEKFSIDNLLSAKTVGSVKDLLRETVKQAGTEASEEMLTEISNILTDAAIMGGNSDFAKMVAAYEEQGLSPEEAKRRAYYDCITQVVWAGVGGALSGGVTGSGFSTVNMYKTQALGRDVKTGSIANVSQHGEVQKALENTDSKEAQKLAKKAQKELEKTGRVSDGTTGQLVQQNAQDLQELIKAAAKSDDAQVQQWVARAAMQQMTGSGVDAATVSGLRAAMDLAEQGSTVSPAAAPQVQQTAQQAVQTKAANPAAEVLNAAETLFVEHGMSLKTAKKRADIVSRLVAGEKVSDDEIRSMEPTNPKTQADFTTLTGVQFPEGVNKSIEKLRATYRSAHEVAVQAAQAQQQQEAQTVAESTTVPEAEVAADARLGLFGADGQELMTLDQFAAANQLAPEVAEEAYMDYVLGNATVEHQGNRMNYTQYGEFLRSAPGGDQLDEDEITAYFERELNRGAEEAGVAPRHSLPEETAAEASAREQIVQAAEKTRSAELEAQAKSIQKTLKDFGLKTTVVVEQNPAFDDFAFYDSTNNRIVFNGQRLTTGNAMVWTLGHELVHKITNNGTQNMEFVDAVISAFDTLNKQNALGGKLKFWMDNMDTRIAELKDTYTLFLAEHGEDTSVVTDEYAREELAGDLMREAFVNEGVLNTLAGDNPGIIYRAQLKVQEWLGKLRGVEQNEAQETLKSLSEKFQNALKQSEVNEAMQPPEKRHSVDSLTEAAGLTFEKDGQLTVLRDAKGNRVNEVTEQMVEKSPLGAVIQSAVDADYITEEAAGKQLTFFSDLFNLMLRTQDIDLLWAVSASIGFQPIESGPRDASTINQKSRFAGYTKNSDPQYSTTVDFTTICLKTQAIIDAMSETMMQLGHGLTDEEIVDIVYRNTHKAGEPVPCPVCYVFSRWVGLGGLFDNMQQLQNQYANVDPEVLRSDIALLEERIDEIMEKRGYAINQGKRSKSYVLPGTSVKKSFGEAKDIMYKDLVTRQTELQSKKNQDSLAGTKTLTKAEAAELEQLKRDIDVLDNWTWLRDVRLSENYEPVPPEILFNINAGKEFAEQYPESWKFRTTRGPSMGKAATPYADEHLGQILRGAGVADLKSADLGDPKKNPFLTATDGKLTPAARKALQKSRAKVKAQNLLNGQRYQSTSDFRFEYALDYLLSFVEMQALGGKVQLYTKVAEAVRMFASVGAEVNCSLMPLGKGYRVNPDGSLTLTFSSVTGMNAQDAFNLSNEFDNVQPIMVGVDNTHIRLCMADDRITFIIPYHASGAGEARYVALMNIVGENVESREDYSTYQTDHKIENPTKEQKAANDLRMRLLTGKLGMLKDADKQVLRNNDILHNLYKRFYGKDVDGNLSDIDPKYLSPEIRESGKLFRDNECYGVFLTKEQAGTVMPFEYWDRTSTIGNADINGQAFVEYCESLGLRPRFSGWDANGKHHSDFDFSKDAGYWKMLIDRSCYNRDGSYHEQQAIDVTNFDADFLLRDKAVKGIVQPSLVNDPAKTAKIAAQSVEEVKARRRHSVEAKKDNLVEYVARGEATGKYWRPKLTKTEWGIIEYRKKMELGDPKFDIDETKKWLYSKQKGTQVFAIYSSENTSDPTVLYAVSGDRAVQAMRDLNFYMEEYNNVYTNDRKALSELLKTVEHQQGKRRTGVRDAADAGAETGDVPVSGQERRGDGNRDSGNSGENLEDSVTNQASEKSGAFNLPSIDELLNMSDEDFQKLYDELGLEPTLDDDILLEDFDIDEYVDEVAEELDTEPEVIEIIYRRAGLGDSHVAADKQAVMTESRIDQRIAESGAGTRPDYARRYITRISPKDFIDLTVHERNTDRETFDNKVTGDVGSTMKDWNYEQQLLESREPPVLDVDFATGQVIGHNGRHRMRALEMAGIESVEIEVEFYDEGGIHKYDAKTIADKAISSQFDTKIETHLPNLIPLNKAYRDEILSNYGEKAHTGAKVKYSVEYADTDASGQLITKQQDKYFAKSKMRDRMGRLMPMFHGTKSFGFTVFDPQFSDDGRSLFFTDRPSTSRTYTGTKKDDIHAPSKDTDLSVYNIDESDIRTADDAWTVLDKLGYKKLTKEPLTREQLQSALNTTAELALEDAGLWLDAIETDITQVLSGYRVSTFLKGGSMSRLKQSIAALRESLADPESVKPGSLARGVLLGDIESLFQAEQQVMESLDYFWEQHPNYDGMEYYEGLKEAISDPEYSIRHLQYLIYAADRNEPTHIVYYPGVGTLHLAEDEVRYEAQDILRNHKRGLYEVYLNLENPLIIDANEANWNALDHGDLTEDGLNEGVYWEGSTTREIAEFAQEAGYDGVIFKNLYDHGYHAEGDEGAATVAIAFRSDQVKSTANENPTKNPDIRYSIDSKLSFADQVELAAKNKLNEFLAPGTSGLIPSALTYSAAYVTKEPNPLMQELGYGDLPLVTTQEHIRQMVGQREATEATKYAEAMPFNPHNHQLTVEQVQRLPELLEKPAAVIRATRGRNDSLVFITTEQDYAGRPIIVPVKANGIEVVYNGVSGPAHIVTSMYGRDNFEQYFTDAVNAGRLVYYNKERIDPMLTAPGYQSSGLLSGIDSDTIMGEVQPKVKDPGERKYSITPEFEKWYKEQYGEEDVTNAQLKRRLETQERRAKQAEESAKAAEFKRVMDTQNGVTAWSIYHQKKMREQKRTYDAKLKAAHDERIAAVRAAVAETKVIERAKAEVQHDADRMAERRNAAKRLRTQENAYSKKVEGLKENLKLKRNAAKATLRDKRLSDRKRAEIETEQGVVNTIRQSPPERTRVERLQESAQNLRTMGRAAYRNFVNVAEAIDRFSKRQVSDMRAGTLVNIVGSSASTIETIFKNGLLNRAGDRIGDSMSEVFLCWDEAHKSVDENKQALLQDFMLHWHNIDRMSIETRAEARLETFELNNEWLRDMDPKELARLIAMTETEAKKLGKEAAQVKAFEYQRLVREYNEAKNKPIFADDKGNAVTAETSQKIVDKYLEENPWLLEKSKGIHEWWDLFMRNWAVGDTISEAEYNRMRQMYPHYVPTYRTDKGGVGGANFVGLGGANVSKAVKRAKGSFAEVVNIEDSFANMVSKIVKLNRVNELYMNIIDTAMLDEDGTFADLAAFDWDSSWQTGAYAEALGGELTETVDDADKAGLEKVGNDYKLTAWRDGRKLTAFISEDLYKSIGGVTGHLANDLEQNLLKVGNTLTGPMKTAITGINPNFALRNISRDLPTAIVNSISGMAFPKYWARAATELKQNSEHWQHFKALGGTNATYYNDGQGFAKSIAAGTGVVAKGVGAIGWFNEVTESQTRFAEYLATVDRLGDTYEARLQGIKNSAEVTVDFSRKGRYGKVINAWVPYWNPAVQGIDKVVRSVIDSPDGSTVWKQASKTLGRAAMTTVLLEAVLQGVLKALDRDDEWEELDDRTKDTYYCIPLKDSHTFLKIPKNREWGAILGTPFMRMLEYANGRENPFENYIETAIEPNFLPPAIFRPDAGGGFSTDMIGFSQMNDLSKNEDFAGRTIVPYAYQQGSLSQQYDAETSWAAKQLGELFNWSPMQIDYIIGDYFGDFGDLFQIVTSEATWSGERSLPEAALDIVASPWTTDNRYSNAGVSKYYDTMDALKLVVNDKKNQLGNEAYKQTVEYQTQKAVTELYGDQISELNRVVRELPDGDEKDAAKAQIAQLTSEALQYYEDCMAGRVNAPVLDAEYKDFNGTVSKELIRLDSLSSEYKFKPTGTPQKQYTDPRNKQREYILTDDQKDYFKELYRETYNEMFLQKIQTSRYMKAKDADKAAMLETLRDDVLDATKDEFFDWLRKSGARSTPKTRK